MHIIRSLDFFVNSGLFVMHNNFVVVDLFNFDKKLKVRLLDQTKESVHSKDFGFKDSILQTQYGAHYITAYQIFMDYPFLGSGIKTFRTVCNKIGRAHV